MNTETSQKIWRWSRRLLVALAVLVTLAAGLIVEENGRSKHAWETYRQSAEARGERFDWSLFGTNALTAEQNFFKAPIFAPLFMAEWDDQKLEWKPLPTNTVDRLKMSVYRSDGSSPKGPGGAWDRARLTQLASWQEYYRNSATNHRNEFPVSAQTNSPASDVLLALSKYDSAIEELRVAGERPTSRIGDYSGGNAQKIGLLLRYLPAIKGCAQVLQLRAIAELADQKSTAALADVQLLLRLDAALRQEPLLIAHLVSLAVTSITLQPIYEGLAQHRWTEVQLAQLQIALAERDYLADFQRTMTGERAFTFETLENQRLTREYKSIQTVGQQSKVVTTSLRLMPSAFFYQNELTLARLNDQFARTLVDVTNHLVSPTRVHQTDQEINTELHSYNPYKVMAAQVCPAFSKGILKFALLQAWLDLAQTGCALERFRLAQGHYPVTLSELSPRFLTGIPHDLINGLPLHYQRTVEGKFILYSVGWDETDDGGQIRETKSGGFDREHGDWVWKY